MPKTTAKSPSPRNEKHDSLKNAMADLKILKKQAKGSIKNKVLKQKTTKSRFGKIIKDLKNRSFEGLGSSLWHLGGVESGSLDTNLRTATSYERGTC